MDEPRTAAARARNAIQPGNNRSAMSRIARRLAFISISALLLSACGGTSSPSADGGELPAVLRVGLIPNIAPDAQRAKYQPFAAYLEKTLNVKVELFVASDYAGVVTALAAGRIDLAYLGGLTYVQAAEQVKLTPLVSEIDATTGTQQYLSAIVVPKDSPIQTVKDIVASKGSFAFGDPASTSGSLYPRISLVRAGAKCDPLLLTSCPPLTQITFTGGHDATAQAVISGKVTAGGIELRILRKLEKEGKVAPGALRVIETQPVQGYPWVIRSALGEAARAQLVAAFTAIADPALLDLLRAKSYVSVTDADYAEIRTQARNLGLIGAKQ